MQAAHHLSTVPQAPARVATSTMFEPGDQVKAKNNMLPFWMTVLSVNVDTGYCRCHFGSSGRYAGNFHESELKFHGGNELKLTAS